MGRRWDFVLGRGSDKSGENMLPSRLSADIDAWGSLGLGLSRGLLGVMEGVFLRAASSSSRSDAKNGPVADGVGEVDHADG